MIDVDAVTKIISRKQILSIVQADARINLWHGAVSSGKTIASLLAFLNAVATAPTNGIIFIIGRTIQTVERNIIEVLQQVDGPFGPFARYVHHTRGANIAVIFGRTIHIVGANDVRSEGKIRGSTASLIYIDEATLIPEAMFIMCLSRLRVPGAKLLATTNPAGPQHWLRQGFLLREHELNMKSWHFTLEDNPWLEADYIAALKTEYVGLWYKRMILGEWCMAEGAIYDMWNPDQHIISSIPPIQRWIGVGVDYGDRHPFAALMLGLGEDRNLYLTGEYRHDIKVTARTLTMAEHSKALRQFVDTHPIPATTLHGVSPELYAVDPAAAAFRIQLLRDGIASYAADNAVVDGIRTVANLIGTDRFYVHESCQGWIEEIPNYAWDVTSAMKGEDKPVKIGDDSLDGGRYIVKTSEPFWASAVRPADL